MKEFMPMSITDAETQAPMEPMAEGSVVSDTLTEGDKAGETFAKNTLSRIAEEIQQEDIDTSKAVEVQKSADELSKKGSEEYFTSPEYVAEIERKQRNWVHKVLKSDTFKVTAGLACIAGGGAMIVEGGMVAAPCLEQFDHLVLNVKFAFQYPQHGHYAYMAATFGKLAGAYLAIYAGNNLRKLGQQDLILAVRNRTLALKKSLAKGARAMGNIVKGTS